MTLPKNLPLRKSILLLSGIIAISVAMHLNHFSKDLIGIHVWRQTQTQITIDNFYHQDFNIFNPRTNEMGNSDGIFRMEFPLMQWLVALLYKIFGDHLIITRISMFITGSFSVVGMFRLLQRISGNDSIGIIAAWTFCFSPCFYFYTINPLPDNFALCCGIWSLAFFFRWLSGKNKWLLIFCGLFLAFSALCKLPFIVFYAVPFSYFTLTFFKQKKKDELINLLLVSAFLLLPLAWYAWVIPQWHNNGIVGGISDNKVSVATLIDYLLFNLISTLPELLINYASVIFFIAGFYFIISKKWYKHTLFPVLVFFSLGVTAYFLFEINMIAKVHDYYLFPFYPLIFILVGYGAYHMFQSEHLLIRIFCIICLAAPPVSAYIRMHNRWNENKPGFNKDLLTYKEELRHAVSDNGLCVMGSDDSYFVFPYYLNKKGWGFNEESFTAERLHQLVEDGAMYLYSDSRKVDENAAMKIFLDSLIVQKGSIRVYRLKIP